MNIKMQLPFDKKVKGWRCPLCKHKWTKKEMQKQLENYVRKAYNLNELFVPHLYCIDCDVSLNPIR